MKTRSVRVEVWFNPKVGPAENKEFHGPNDMDEAKMFIAKNREQWHCFRLFQMVEIHDLEPIEDPYEHDSVHGRNANL